MRRLSSVVIAAVLLAFSAQAVSADALLADGDGLAPVANGRLNLGTICHGTAASATVLVAVRATGHPNGRQVFENGATVETSALVVSGDGLSAGAVAPTLVMAANWRSQPNGTFSAPAAWDVSVTPTALGRYRGAVAFSASGLNRHGETITRTRRMNVVARVVDCSPPVIAGIPADLVVEAVAPDGTDVAYSPPTATDAVDGPVAVTCDLPPFSRVAVGNAAVTCTAVDAAGNASSAGFAVTVVDTSAPTLYGMPSDVLATAMADDGLVVDWSMPTATDLVDGPLPVTCDTSPASLFAVGTTVVTCSAADGAGNVATAAFTVDVAAPPVPDPDPDDNTQPDTDTDTEPTDPDPVPSTDPNPAPSTDMNPAPSTDEATAGASGGPESADGSALPDTSMRVPPTVPPALGFVLLALAILAGRRKARTALPA